MKDNLHTPHSIRTHSGIYVNFVSPRPDMFSINDIAHALSFIPRWGGHTPKAYSVAQHSVECARMAMSGQYKLEALLHDATEAYMMDLPSPLKKLLPEYKAMESRIMQCINTRFNLRPMDDYLKTIDEYQLKREWAELVLRTRPCTITIMSPAQAKAAFLKSYHMYTKLAATV